MEEKCKTGDLCNGRVLSADTGIPDVQGDRINKKEQYYLKGENEQLVMIVATILFLIVGVGLIGFGTINVYKNMKKNQSTDKDRNEE